MFVDSHAHIDGKQFTSDREAMLARAREAGVEAMVTIGNGDGPDEMACGIPYAEKYDWIYTTLGVHPHEARLMEPRHLATMEELSRHPRVIAIGEIGLDYFYDHSPRELQQQVFVAQMELAKKVAKPIILHISPATLRRTRGRTASACWPAIGAAVDWDVSSTVSPARSSTRSAPWGLAAIFPSPAISPSRRRRTSAAPPGWSPSTASSSRPIVRILRRFRIAESAMNRPSSWRPPARSVNSGASAVRRSAD